MNLTDLQQGKTAVVLDVTKLNDIVKQRLIDMGLVEGQEVCLKCTMPFGGPVMVEVCGQCLSLRRKEASRIGVR
ncbi:iron transporter [Virgibacillus pantothenticus]|uniref:FeoA family protein n=1 Tax=Virgibacillus pantothenticus TaxID=1473 RepID=UPI001B25F03C|nr:FeoA family protein [Virgibacillus pantothenticus]MBU8568946.1 ferrous iron transport protein A [Virgibacillus pantothenticus]MBU8602981.1 ferrous iron transport protein A [Virgibacillus pantothenticus]MBU8637067.1 ferrous iron transport protein A [Virgibacillus pantothenticus]MBU8644859.1 ferrous iron transport protein A [Virgibacillus pantothenticus]MBU8649002.1 ferrous iron transport protein A [Virgibacillus pantothenticus]